MKALGPVPIPKTEDIINTWKWKSDPSSSNAVGAIVSEVLKYSLVLGGISMFAFLIIGGFTLLTSAGNPNGIKSGTNKIVFAITGFLIIFATYWIIQLVQVIFGLTIL